MASPGLVRGLIMLVRQLHDVGDEGVCLGSMTPAPQIPIEPNMAGDVGLGRANLGCRTSRRYDEAFAAYDMAQSIAPDAPAYQARPGHSFTSLRETRRRWECFDQAVRLDPENPLTHLSRSTVLLTLVRFAEGWTEYEWRKRTVRKDGARPYPQPPLSGLDDIKDATVLLFGEQGFGDQIQFCRYAKLLSDRGAKVLLNADRQLVQLFKSLDQVQIVEAGSTAAAVRLSLPSHEPAAGFRDNAEQCPSRGAVSFCRARKIEKVGEQTRKQIETQSRPCLVRRI